VVLCTICNIVSMCTSCIDFQGQENTKALNFECPPCFVKRDAKGVYVCQHFMQVIEQCLHYHLATYPSCCFLYKGNLAKDSRHSIGDHFNPFGRDD